MRATEIQNLFAGNICRLLAETEIDYSEFIEMLEEGEVEEVHIEDELIYC